MYRLPMASIIATAAATAAVWAPPFALLPLLLLLLLLLLPLLLLPFETPLPLWFLLPDEEGALTVVATSRNNAFPDA